MNPRNADFVMCFKVAKYYETPKYKDFMKNLVTMRAKKDDKVDFSAVFSQNLSIRPKDARLLSVVETVEQIDDICKMADEASPEFRGFIIQDYAEHN